MSGPDVSTGPSCGCSKPNRSNNRLVRWAAGGGILASLGVCAACCLLPAGLLALGVGGAWVSALDSLADYKWIFIAVTTLLLAYGFYAAYWKPRKQCSVGAACPTCGTSRSLRAVLWIATVLAIAGLIFERLEPLLN